MIKDLCVELPKSVHKKTIVFDLDETLVHCVEDPLNESCHLIIDIKFSEEPEPIRAGINIRPGAKECLEYASKLF